MNRNENQMIIKALNMYGRVPEMWELLEEIERLNNIINKKEQFLGDNIKRLEREVVKRDNIINELEKWLISEIKRIEELQNPAKNKVKPYGEEYNNYTLIIGAYDNVLDKIQELKGSESNE